LIEGEMHPPLGPPNQGRSYDLDCLAAFIDSLPPPPSPGPPSEAALRGQVIFNRADTGCAVCHLPSLYTDLKTHDVGTAPYLHDGSAPTLYDVLTTRNPEDKHGITSHLTEQELQDLVAFLLALPLER